MRLYEERTMTYYVWKPGTIWNASKGPDGEVYKYWEDIDGVRESIWLYDSQCYAETDPNNDNGDLDGKVLYDVLEWWLRMGYVASAYDPMKNDNYKHEVKEVPYDGD